MTARAAPRRCAAQTKAGKPCGAFAVAGSDKCFRHSPAMRKAARAANRRGGREKARRARLGTIPAQMLERGLAHPGAALEPMGTAGLDLESVDGLRRYGARILRHLASLPFSVGVTHAMVQALGLQARLVADAELADRLDELQDELAARERRAKLGIA